MDKKKKAIIIGAVAAITVAAVGVGLFELQKFYKTVDYTTAKVADIMKAETHLVAHRGFRAVAPENTLPAFEEAGKAGFWGNECDIYRTADGVWVVHHDYNTFRMMNAVKNIEKCTYEELLELSTNNGHNIEQYEDLKICTFEEYLEVCRRFNMNAFIELKSKKNTEYYDEVTALVEKYGVTPTYISFQLDNLKKIRELDKEAQLLFIVDEISDKAIEEAKSIDNCGIDFGVDEAVNFENDCELIKKCTAAGLPLGAWAVDDTKTMKTLVDLGVKYITTDCLTEY